MNQCKEQCRNHRGFTLIEVVIYMGIIVVLMVLVVRLYISAEKAERKEQSIAAVEFEGAEALSTILQSVRNAQTITAPSLGSTANSLTLVTYASSTSPTVFTLSGSTVQMTEGSAAAVSLTGSDVAVTNFSVQNVGSTSTYGSIQVQFTLSHASTTQAYDTTYSKTFTGSATVRRISQ